MSELEPLIADLALILICAGAMTLLFKRLKQPVVLGYIVAGFLAIVLMVMLSTLAVSKEFEGSQMIMSILKLAFFLVLWFVVGIYIIPLFLRKVKPLMSNETLLITALALCFGMVVIASAVGFSAAFGAFIMGSILAETVEREQIEHLVSPVKDLFGAIFFVSVGMMVDVVLIAEYIVPILCIVVAIMLGQTILSTCGFLLAGQSLKTSMQCSFSLTQIGEFAFILATLGTSLGVTSDFLYPIVVAVSVFTTFTTPYMIRLAEPAYAVVERVMPQRWRSKLQDYAEASNNEMPQGGEQQSRWKSHLKSVALTVGIHSVLCMAIIALVLYFGKPFISNHIPAPWDGIVTALITLILVAPFLWMLMRQGDSDNTRALWNDNRFSQAKLVALQFFRLFIAAAFVSYILGHTIHWGYTSGILLVLAIIFSIAFSPRLRKRSEQINQTFTENLAQRENTEQ